MPLKNYHLLVGRAVDYIYEKHQRHGLLRREIERMVNQDRNFFAAAMLALGEADAMITGTTRPFSQSLRQVRTVIEDDAFIGSDSQLVAPVTVGKGATLGAGTTLTKDAPAGKLTISRPKQMTIEGWSRPVKKPK